jgi:hypothetical protein
MKTATASCEMQDYYLLKQFGDVAVLKFGRNFLADTIDQALENPLLDVFDHTITGL